MSQRIEMLTSLYRIYQMDKELLDRVGKTECKLVLKHVGLDSDNSNKVKYLTGADGRGLLHLLFGKGGGHYPDQGECQFSTKNVELWS